MSEAVNLPGKKRVENNTTAFLFLPPTQTFHQGIKLAPGLNTVPTKYFEEAYAVERKEGAGKTASTKYPLREEIERLQVPVFMNHAVRGRVRQPFITIFDPDQVTVKDRPDGPPLEESLERYPVNAALALINHVSEVPYLEAWASDKRMEVAVAARNKLQLVTAGKGAA